jgi:hypothetical protein
MPRMRYSATWSSAPKNPPLDSEHPRQSSLPQGHLAHRAPHCELLWLRQRLRDTGELTIQEALRNAEDALQRDLDLSAFDDHAMIDAAFDAAIGARLCRGDPYRQAKGSRLLHPHAFPPQHYRSQR